jgi:prevent-host-death family protein
VTTNAGFLMKTVSLRDAKAGFSNLVDEAISGEIVEITRHGKPVAALISIEAARKMAATDRKPNFGRFLLTFPGPLEIERDTSPMRDVDL